METSKRAKLLGTSGGAFNTGNFQGFMNAWSQAQIVGVSGGFIYNHNGSNTTGITMFISAGQVVPITCNYVRGFSGPVLAFLP